MHSNQETLLLDVLYSDQDAMTILNFHALTMDHVVIIWVFLIKTKLNLLQTSKVIEGKDKCACLSWFLNLKPHVGDISELLDSSVNVFKTFIQDWNVMISFGFNIFCKFAEEIFGWLFILTMESRKLIRPCCSVCQSTLNLLLFIINRDKRSLHHRLVMDLLILGWLHWFHPDLVKEYLLLTSQYFELVSHN